MKQNLKQTFIHFKVLPLAKSVVLRLAKKQTNTKKRANNGKRSNNWRHTLEIEAHNNRETRVAYYNSTWHAINIGYINWMSPWWSSCTLYRIPGGRIVSDLGLCCLFNVWRHLFERNYFPLLNLQTFSRPRSVTFRILKSVTLAKTLCLKRIKLEVLLLLLLLRLSSLFFLLFLLLSSFFSSFFLLLLLLLLLLVLTFRRTYVMHFLSVSCLTNLPSNQICLDCHSSTFC